MSFSLTTDQMRNFQKTVTRRNGWDNIQPGQIVQAIVKGQGLKKGEHVEKIHLIQIIGKRKEPLRKLLDYPEYGARDMIREGFPDKTPAEFVAMYCKHNNVTPEYEVNRIGFRFYMDFNQPIIVPKRIAVCPGCNGELIAEMDGWEQDDKNGTWYADSTHLYCDSMPIGNAPHYKYEQYEEAHHNVDSMPYVYWLPALNDVEAWVKATFRFNMKDEA